MDLRVMGGRCRGLVMEALSHSRDQRTGREQNPGCSGRRNSNVTGALRTVLRPFTGQSHQHVPGPTLMSDRRVADVGVGRALRQWLDGRVSARSSRVVILGGGPGGYEAALVAAHLGADVTVVERDGLGGAAVLTDCVPSKTLIATADYMSAFETAADLGVHLEDAEGDEVADAVAELGEVNRRVLALAAAQSADIATRLAEVGVRVLAGRAVLTSPTTVRAETADGVARARDRRGARRHRCHPAGHGHGTPRR